MIGQQHIGREAGRGITDHSWMVALRSINEFAEGWYRASHEVFTVAGAALALHQTSHLTLQTQLGAPKAALQGKVWWPKCQSGYFRKCIFPLVLPPTPNPYP